MKAIIEESVSHVRQRFRLRVLEWQNATIAIGFGLFLLFNPDLFAAASFRGFIGGNVIWGIASAGVGMVGVVALIINGTVPKPTAALRTIAALLEVLLFLMVCLGFLVSGTWTTGIWTYGVIGAYGFLGACWALLDAVAPEYGQ